MEIYLDHNLKGSKLKQFIEFVKKISNSYSIARNFDGSLPEDMLQGIQIELKEYFLQAHNERREKYTKNPEYRKTTHDTLGISNSNEAMKYFDLLLDQDMQMLELISVNGNDQKFDSNCDELIEVRYTRKTFVTIGGIFEVCYFTYGTMLSEILKQLNSLFELPYQIDTYQFMDLAFYNRKEVKLAICSHEQYAYMDLKEEEYTEFLTLDIPHST